MEQTEPNYGYDPEKEDLFDWLMRCSCASDEEMQRRTARANEYLKQLDENGIIVI